MVHVNFDHIRCDFLVTSVHKSIGAPLSCGVLVMRPERAGDVWHLRLLVNVGNRALVPDRASRYARLLTPRVAALREIARHGLPPSP